MSSFRQLPVPVAVVGIFIVTCIAFAPLVRAEFTSWDDYETVARNPLLNPPRARSLAHFWTRPHGDLYIPVTYTTWFVAAQVAYDSASRVAPPRLDPRVFHGLNIALHAAAACVAFRLLELLTEQRVAALTGALLFALHPVQVEAVAWVSGMKDVLFGLLALVAMWQYLIFARGAEPKKQWGRYAVATVAFVLAMLAKPTAMVLPLVVIVLDYAMLGRPLKDAMRSAWPWLVLAVPCAIATKIFQPAPHARDAAVALWARPLVAADALAFYLYKLVWPARLGFDYGRTPQYVRASGMIAWTWIVPAMAAAIAWWSWRRGGRAVAAGLAVMVIVLLPVLGLVPFDFQTYSTVADHYLYLAMIGPALVVAWLVSRRATTGVIAVAACIVALLGARTFAQAAHWRDSRALFTHGLAVNPRSFASYAHLAAMAIDGNRPDEALALIGEAMKIRPDAARYATYAEALRRKGRTDEAIAAFQEAVRRDHTYAPALANLAAILAEQGRLDEAIPLARRAVEVEPNATSNRFNLALMYLNSGQPALARPQLEAVLQLDPTHAAARELLGQL